MIVDIDVSISACSRREKNISKAVFVKLVSLKLLPSFYPTLKIIVIAYTIS